MFINFDIGSIFSNNQYKNVNLNTLASFGLGSISFNGKLLSIRNSIFSKNNNTAGGAIYLKGSRYFFLCSTVLQNVQFNENSAVTYGGAICFGSDMLQFQGKFINITTQGSWALSIYFWTESQII